MLLETARSPMGNKPSTKAPKLVSEYDKLEAKFQSFDVKQTEDEYVKLDESLGTAIDTTSNGFAKAGKVLQTMRALLSERSPEHKAVLEKCKNIPTTSWTEYLEVAASKMQLSVGAVRDRLKNFDLGKRGSASAQRQADSRAKNPKPNWHEVTVTLLNAVKLGGDVAERTIAAVEILVAKFPLKVKAVKVAKTAEEVAAAAAAKMAEREANAARKTAQKVATAAQRKLDREARAERKRIDRRDGPAATGAKKKGRPAGSKSKQKPNGSIYEPPITVKIPWSTVDKTQDEIDAHLATV
jgi:hypothetical protein